MKRRQLLQLAALTGAGLFSPPLFRATLGQQRSRSASVLVWVELRGGNDGLNTVIPYREPIYRQARPQLSLSEGPSLGDGLLLHPALSPLVPIWDSGRLALALGVGWPTPTRSHFLATDQWAAGTASGLGVGWLAKGCDSRGIPGPLVGLGPTGTAAIEGGRALSVQLSPTELGADPPALEVDPALLASRPELRQMLDLDRNARTALAELQRQLPPLPSKVSLPRQGLGPQVALALRLIASSNPPRVIQLELSGFDNHGDQLRRHGAVLHQLALALQGFEQGLDALRNRPQVTVLVTSEFGRRLAQNASGGTDHGSASVAFLLGDDVPHPFIGHYPSFKQLDDRGDLIPNLTPPQLYERVLKILG